MQPLVFFDLGNVLIHFDHQIAVDQLAEVTGQEVSQVRHAVFDSGLQDAYETGRVTSHQFAQRVNDHLGTDLPAAAILEAISAIFHPNEEILPLLSELRGRGIPLAVLSNTCEAHWQWIARQNWSLPGDWFDFHVLSFEVHSMKPGAGIYEVCEARAERSPEQLFFTDDRPENCQAAEERGWTTHQFQSIDALQQQLSIWLAAQA